MTYNCDPKQPNVLLWKYMVVKMQLKFWNWNIRLKASLHQLSVICNWFCDSPIISNIPPLWLIIHKDIHTVSHHTNVYLSSCGNWKMILSYKVHIHCRQMWKSSVTEWCPNDDHHGHPMMSKWSPCSCRVDWLLVTKCGFTCDSSCPTFPLLLKYTFGIDIFEILSMKF